MEKTVAAVGFCCADVCQELDKVYPGPLSSTQDADGKYYGLPQNTNCLALACNMDMLAEAGFDHAPTSLDEFVEMCAAATNTAEGIYGYAMCCVSNEEGTFQLLPWLRSTYNGKSVNVDELTAESSVHGLSVLADLVKNGYMSKEVVNWTQSDAMNQLMAGGGVALIGATLVPLLSGLFG